MVYEKKKLSIKTFVASSSSLIDDLVNAFRLTHNVEYIQTHYENGLFVYVVFFSEGVV